MNTLIDESITQPENEHWVPKAVRVSHCRFIFVFPSAGSQFLSSYYSEYNDHTVTCFVVVVVLVSFRDLYFLPHFLVALVTSHQLEITGGKKLFLFITKKGRAGEFNTDATS